MVTAFLIVFVLVFSYVVLIKNEAKGRHRDRVASLEERVSDLERRD